MEFSRTALLRILSRTTARPDIKNILLVLALLALASALPPTARGEPPPSAPPAAPAAPANAPLGYGLDSGGTVIYNPTALSRARSSGARWMRLAVYWSSVEPTDLAPSQYHWSGPDKDLGPLINGGLTPVVYVSSNPGWASALRCGPINTENSGLVADFGEFMRALADRYRQVPVWILYNEADNARTNIGTDGCFGAENSNDANKNGVPDTGDYAVMLATARDAVRQINPNVKVAISVAFDNFHNKPCPPGYPGGCPGESNFDYNFLPNLFAYINAHPRAEPYADYIAFNYYDVYGPYWESRVAAKYHGIQAKAQFIRQLMQQGGVNFGLFVTETGESSDPDWVGLDGQSQCVVTQMVRGSGAGLDGVSWWSLVDVPGWGYYGILDVNLNPKPSYTAYQVLVSKLEGYRFAKNISTKNVEAYQFVDGTKKRIVAWSAVVETPSNARCADLRVPKPLTVKKVKKISVTDLYNKTTTLIKDNKKGDSDKRSKIIKFKVSSAPVYVDLNP